VRGRYKQETEDLAGARAREAAGEVSELVPASEKCVWPGGGRSIHRMAKRAYYSGALVLEQRAMYDPFVSIRCRISGTSL
jgi:hypothetical protein